MELSLKDKKILYELEKNARSPNSEVAKVVGLSKDAVGYRIKQLENRGIVRGYRALVDVSKLGYRLFRIYLRLIDTNKKDLEEIISYLKKEKSTWWIGRLDGSWDFAFAHWGKDDNDFYDFFFEFQKKFRKNIKEKMISPIIEYREFPKKYLVDSNKYVSKKESAPRKIKVDNLDLDILKKISKNAREQIVDLAEEFGVDSKTVINRIKKLEEGKIIIGYKTDLDISKLGRDFYTIEVDLNSFSKFKEIEKEIFSLKEFSGKSVSIGGYDLEFDLDVENTQKYYSIIDNLKNKFPEIREIRYFRVIENYKIIYMPEE